MNKRFVWVSGFLLVSLLLLTSCTPVRNPPLNSVVTAHGNTDWHIDTAEEFLYGTEMSGAVTAANHVPDTWTRSHMHIGLTNTNNFYYDVDKIATGADTNASSGIENAMLFFYAGHGWPESFDTLGNSGIQSNMSLGDYPGGGRLRYYWQCSCEVFAHGPQTCPGATWEYACPGSFDGSADSAAHRNVYERWGPVLNNDLRMACGASTAAYCHEDQANLIWDNYNNNGFDVADSFIDGLNVGGVVPLCITKGGSDVTATPLYDTTFTNLPNASGHTYYHIQYLSNFASTPTHPILNFKIPKYMPIYTVRPFPLPDPIRDIPFKEMDGWLISPEVIDSIGPVYRVNMLSGSVYTRGPRLLDVKRPALSESEYLELAFSQAQKLGWMDGKTFSGPYGEAMMLTSQPIEGASQESRPLQKNVIVTFRRTIDVDGLAVNVLGAGGTIRVQMNNDGTMLNASIVWREIDGVVGEVQIKTYEQALQEAWAQIKEADAYKLDQWNWGYKEESGNIEQTELHIVFQFTFVPKDPEALLKYPPQLVEISGELR
jgi:hypothetical protein